MAITADFDPVTGTLTETGDAADNAITTSRDAAGTILVNGGAVPVTGGTPTVANTNLIQAFGQDGEDTIALDESNGALPAANLFGGNGNDALTGGSGSDQLFGEADNDILLGKGGVDLLFGGDGNDVLTGGDADDQMFGGAGNDRIIWNPGDDTDLAEGDAGTDTLEVNGGNGAEIFTITPNGARVRVDRVNPAPFSIDAGTIENIVINANGGDDIISGANGLAALVSLTIDGGAGNDSITGGDGADILLGGDGNDQVAGARGNDVASLGAGNDTFVWNPGDGSDTVEGDADFDTLVFDGANIAEQIDISANGSRVRFTRDIGNIVMDLNAVERIDFHALGGVDNIVVHDLTGTGVAGGILVIDLASAPGSGVGDGAADAVTLEATAADDIIAIGAVGATVGIGGLPVSVAIQQAEGANDALTVAGGAGNDIIAAGALPAGIIRLTLDGGSGNDIIVGSAGADTLLGGDGDDVVVGGRGDDLAFLGIGNDTFVWSPGDGSDTVEGQSDIDTLIFNGANIAEQIDISANGGRVRFFRDIGNITMDLDDVERVDFHALGAADRVTVNDLSGTDLSLVRIDLESALGSGIGDGALDQVTVNGTAGDDVITLTGVGTTVAIAGLAASTVIFHTEATDVLVINAGAGDDVINASAVAIGSISLNLNGGQGADVIIGSSGNDLVAGGDGDDTALLGAGNDTFVWNPGDDNDIVEGQAGFDTLVFNGAIIAENIDISANGGRVLFFRDIANVVMDLNDVDRIDFHAFGGADRVTVHDLSGTDLAGGLLVLDLASAPGSGVGDGQVDRVTVEATAGDDMISIGAAGATIGISGLPPFMAIRQAEGTDELTVTGGGGNDVIGASGVAAGSIALTLDGGAGNDALIGGQGNDVLHGGADNDILFGNTGVDSMFGETGADTFAFTGTSFATLDTGVGAARDVVQDFAPDDLISLLNIDADFAAPGDQAFAFIGTAAFSAAGQVRFFTDGLGNTIVEGNVDSNLAVDFQIELHNFNAALQANNFV